MECLWNNLVVGYCNEIVHMMVISAASSYGGLAFYSRPWFLMDFYFHETSQINMYWSWAHLRKGGGGGYWVAASAKLKFKKTGLVDAMIFYVLHDLPISQHQPLKSADD
jgi:hypothetical protein